MIAGHDLVLYPDGSPTRTFCYVADAVTGYFLVLGKGGAGEPYNVGIDGPETSMADLAENVARLGRELFVSGRSRPRGEPREGVPDRQPQPPQPRHHQGAPTSVSTPRSASRRACDAPCSGTAQTAAGRKHEHDGRRKTEDGRRQQNPRSGAAPFFPSPRGGARCGAAGSEAG